MEESREVPGTIEEQNPIDLRQASEPLDFYRVDVLVGNTRSSSSEHRFFESREKMEKYVLNALIDEYGYWASRRNKAARAASSSIRWACHAWFDRVLFRDKEEPKRHTLQLKHIWQLGADGEWHEIFYELQPPRVIPVLDP